MLFIVGVISSPINGFRVLNTVTGETRDFTEKELTAKLLRSEMVLSNATLKDGKLHGTNGTLERYGNIYGQQVPVVLMVEEKPDGDKVYHVSNSTGQVTIMGEENLIALIKSMGAANAKYVNKGDKGYISPIRGTFNRKPDINKTQISLHPVIEEAIAKYGKENLRGKQYWAAEKLSRYMTEGERISPNVTVKRFDYTDIGFFNGYSNVKFSILLVDRDNRRFRIISNINADRRIVSDFQVYAEILDTVNNSWNRFKGLESSNEYFRLNDENQGNVLRAYNMITELVKYIEDVFY